MHQLVQITLKQDTDQGESDDGMELGLCYITEGGRRMSFAGARFSLFALMLGSPTIEIKGDKRGIGYRKLPFTQQYNEVEVDVMPGMRFYMTSDGLTDQIGSKARRGFSKARFLELIGFIGALPMIEQKVAIWQALLDHQGTESRRDDLSVVGFQLQPEIDL